MAQSLVPIKPIKVNTDADISILQPDESPFIKNALIMGGQNGEKTGQDGGNSGLHVPIGSPVLIEVPGIPDPGKNIVIGGSDFKEGDVDEVYVLFWNPNGNHGIYRINRRDLSTQIVKIDPEFKFSLDPKHAIPAHRTSLKIVYVADDNQNRIVKEKHFKFTDGNNWQRWINVEACIATNGFDSANSYWKLQPPHFDKSEFIDWAVRPPMYAPAVDPIPVSEIDKGKYNTLLGKSTQFAFLYILTDGRGATLSPYSIPYLGIKSALDIGNTSTPRRLKIGMYAGSALVEKIILLQRNCGGDWKKYDVIEKFSSCDDNAPEKIGMEYWKRISPWAGLNYNKDTNTIEYEYTGENELGLFSQDDAERLQSDLPILSVGHTSAGDADLLADNLYGYENLPCENLKNIEIVTGEVSSDNCPVNNVTIKLYAYMSMNGDVNQLVYRETDDEGGEVLFGGLKQISNVLGPVRGGAMAVSAALSRFFKLSLGQKDGFICYLAGTPYYAIGKQMLVLSDGTKTDIGVINKGNKDNIGLAIKTITGGGFFVQEFTFNVPAGNYIARLSGHGSDIFDNYQDTSTYVAGVVNTGALNNCGLSHSDLKSHSKEIEINATSDVDMWGKTEAGSFYIFVPYQYYEDGVVDNRRYKFIDGYIREDQDSGIGVELLKYGPTEGKGSLIRTGDFTDHNGFYFAYTAKGEAMKADVRFDGILNCKSFGTLFSNKFLKNDRGYYSQDISVKDNNNNSFGDCNRVLVKGKMTNCATGSPISGVAVTVTRGGTYYSNSEGEVELIVHNSFDIRRKDRIYINASEGSVFNICDCDIIDVVPYDEGQAPCSDCSIRNYPITIDTQIKLQADTTKGGLKEGGRYVFGITGFDLAGRATFINRLQNVEIPSFIETGIFEPSGLSWKLKGKLNLPSHIAWVTFWRTVNLNATKFIQWVGDKIEFLDRDGKVTKTGNGAIRARISIQSLMDYNKQNNFSTTVGYQFTQGDQLRIYDDGDGKMFAPTGNDGFMDYTILGSNFNETIDEQLQTETPEEVPERSIIINYDSRLKQLSDSKGFWLEIISPRELSDTEKYCEIVGTYPVINGEIAGGLTSGQLPTFDTYYLNRNFPIPASGGKTFGHPFASDSVTDFWGKECTSCGRQHTRDDRAESKWYPDDCIKSDDFVNEGRVNGLGTFRYQNRKQFKGQEFGGIVALHAERNIIAFICQNDWFITDYERNFVKVTANGLIQADLNRNLGDPHQKVGDNYGCDFEDTSSIDFYDGLGLWADRKNSSIILMDYSSATEISAIKNKSYFINKFRDLSLHNELLTEDRYLMDLMTIIGKVDPVSRNYHVTFRPRRNLSVSPDSFINNEREVVYDMQETFCYNLDMKEWSQFTSYTPEHYCRISGKGFMAFVNGIPYLFSSNPLNYNEFFGVECDQVIDAAFPIDRSKDKMFIGFSIQGGMIGYFADSVTTSKAKSFSYIPMGYWGKTEGVYYASMLCDMTTYPDPNHPVESMLVDGYGMSGQHMRARFVRDVTKRTEYNELDNIWARFFGR